MASNSKTFASCNWKSEAQNYLINESKIFNRYKLLQSVALLLFTFSTMIGAGQCVVINEVMINGPGSSDGSNTPNTEEWVELYNTCSSTIDLSCYVISDGDFTVTFPQGTTIEPNGFLTIGSNAAGFTVSVNWTTCGCTSGSSIGVFTNNNEQLVLTNGSGQVQDAVIWGVGQMPVDITTAATQGCAPVNMFFSTTNTVFETLPATTNNNGCTAARACDGGTAWLVKCLPSITPGTSNSGLVVSIDLQSNLQTICAGDCINFTGTSAPNPTAWSWQFPGAQGGTSFVQNPVGVCYNNVGDYDVTMTVINSCGPYSLTIPNYIHVLSNEIPVITADGPTALCAGETVTLSTTASTPFNWQHNGVNIPGATGSQYVASIEGIYSLITTNANCPQSSNQISVSALGPLPISINPNTDVVICEDSYTLEGTSTGSFQWFLNGNPIAGATSSNYIANTGGQYYFFSEQVGFCGTTSNQISLTLVNVTIDFASSIQTICEGDCIDFTDLSTPLSNSWNWQFAGSQTVTSSIQNPSGICYNSAGNFAVAIEVINSCGTYNYSIPDYIEVILTEIPEITADGPTAICTGESVTLSASGVGPYVWQNNGVNIPGATDQQYIATTSGTYTVRTTSALCPRTSNAISVTNLNTVQVVIIPGTDVVVCDSNYVIQGNSTGSFQWYFNNIPIPGATSNTYIVTVPGQYKFYSEQSGLCPAYSNTIVVSINNTASVSVVASRDSACVGESIDLTATGIFNTLFWSNGSTSTVANVTVGGVYDVTATTGNCSATASVTVLFLPLPIVDAGPDINSDCFSIIEIEGTGEGSLRWIYNNSEVSSTALLPISAPSGKNIYTLEASLLGCIATDDVLLSGDCVTLYIPNSFTPDGDGINDVFKVIAHGIKDYQLTIYNRWGDAVFTTKDTEAVWTGGMFDYYVPDGIYIYHVKAIDFNNADVLDEQHTRGTITVLR